MPFASTTLISLKTYPSSALGVAVTVLPEYAVLLLIATVPFLISPSFDVISLVLDEPLELDVFFVNLADTTSLLFMPSLTAIALTVHDFVIVNSPV